MAYSRQDDAPFEEHNGIFMPVIDRLLGTATKPSNIAWSVGALVTVGYVFSNALFFQAGAHPAVFFETRDLKRSNALTNDELALPTSDLRPAPRNQSDDDKPVTRIVLDQTSNTKPQPVKSPNKQVAVVVETNAPVVPETEQAASVENELGNLQSLLAQLGFYGGEVDGLDGPQTRQAIETYKSNVGLSGIELSYSELILSAKNNLIVTAAIPKVRPNPVIPGAETLPSRTVSKVQAGLKAFGNQNIEVDGILGSNTNEAIREFQSLFKLPITGKIDQQLIQKMTEYGLIE